MSKGITAEIDDFRFDDDLIEELEDREFEAKAAYEESQKNYDTMMMVQLRKDVLLDLRKHVETLRSINLNDDTSFAFQKYGQPAQYGYELACDEILFLLPLK